MKIYLAGPMRGLPDLNYAAFNHASRILREQGHEVFSPAEEEIKAQDGPELRKALETNMQWICRHADTIAMLPGWERSKGARAKLSLAEALSLNVLFLGAYFGKAD